MAPWGSSKIGQGLPFTDTQAKWIWAVPNADKDTPTITTATFTTTLIVTNLPIQVALRMIVDDVADVYVNGALVLSTKWGWDDTHPSSTATWPVTLTLPQGVNTISVRASNSLGGPAGLLASISTGPIVLTRTSSAWTWIRS
ncbi:hypothetical protein Vretifemale_16198 [Volvox reticuliferus]|uniref:Uncharacterized protein n=1 Tax=Volvox reticuliferus TaxID=1737510 RepID=A0A8J4CTG4_9CHLO|nr:hypothetical protein Vretifemale_16198 [Volvox reticuliferus]